MEFSSTAINKFIFFNFYGNGGFFLDEEKFIFLIKFVDARKTALTWGEFLECFQAHEIAFMMDFTQGDEVKPELSDSLCSLVDDVYLLSDDEFPLPQLADWTYSTLKELSLTQIGEFDIIMTEYGEPIGLYDSNRIIELADELIEHGFKVEIGRLPPERNCLNAY